MFVIAAIAIGCPDDPGGTADGGSRTDGGPADGGDLAVRERIVPTSGGRDIASPSYRARIGVGAPQPMGETEGPAGRAATGPEPRP